MGVDIVDIPPHLNPPPPRGEEVIFFDSIGVLIIILGPYIKRTIAHLGLYFLRTSK